MRYKNEQNIKNMTRIDWRDTPNGPAIEVTWDYTCTGSGFANSTAESFELEQNHPLYENGKEVARANINVWSGCPAAPATFLLEEKSEPVNGQRVIGLVIPPHARLGPRPAK